MTAKQFTDAEQRCRGVRCRDVLTLCDGYDCAFGNDYAYCCALEAGHTGPHREEFEHEGKSVVIEWHVEDDDGGNCNGF